MTPGVPTRPRGGREPNGSTGTVDELDGDRDVSVPVCSIDAYRRADRVPAPGRPHLLRPGGWVYLRSRGRLGARVRAVDVGHVRFRRRHTGGPGSAGDLGPGTVIHVDPSTFERVDIDLGPDAVRMRSGIRYLRAAPDGTVVHLYAGEPVPDGDWDDRPPPAARGPQPV